MTSAGNRGQRYPGSIIRLPRARRRAVTLTMPARTTAVTPSKRGSTMAHPVVTLYIDYKSPYAYVAKAGAYKLEEDYDVALRWLPYTLDIPHYLGDVENRTAHQWRRVRYSYMDARRFANQQGLILRGPQ